MDSWLLHRLTGGAVHATDVTNASRTLFFNIHSLEWDPTLLRILEVPSITLPQVHPSAYVFGESTFGGLFGRPVPITALVGDSHSAMFGERCFHTGEAKATLGTGSSVLINAGSSVPPLGPSAMSTIGFGLKDGVHYALEGIVVSAGSILTWLGRDLGFFDHPSEIDSIVGELDSSGGVSVIPGHAGLGAPFWKMDAKGSITGLTFGSTRAHILRAALECIPYQIRAILDAVQKESGVRCSRMRADGGISRNEFVVRWLANTLRIPVHTMDTADVTGLGAALLAGLGAGIYSGLEEIAQLPIGESIREPEDHEQGEPARKNERTEHPALAGYRQWHTEMVRCVTSPHEFSRNSDTDE